MDLQGVAANAPGMNPAAPAKQAEQAPKEQQVQAVKDDTPKQGQAAGLAPGVGQNLNVTV